jgi:hypothetical protein
VAHAIGKPGVLEAGVLPAEVLGVNAGAAREAKDENTESHIVDSVESATALESGLSLRYQWEESPIEGGSKRPLVLLP